MPSTRYMLYATIALNLCAIAIALCTMFMSKTPDRYTRILDDVEQTYQQNRTSDNSNDLQRYYDNMWAGFKAAEMSRQAMETLSQTALRVGVLFFVTNVVILTIAVRMQKT